MLTTAKEISTKDLYVAGDLEMETELLQKEIVMEGVTIQTPVLSIYCC